MLKKLSPKKKDIKSFKLIDDLSIDSISRNIYFNQLIINDRIEFPSCINCEEKFCYKFSEQETDINIFSSLPFNNDLRVCPVNAITLNIDNSIEISDSCISCGLCVQRCPIGGLHLEIKNNYKATKYGVNENVFQKSDDVLGSSLNTFSKIQTEFYPNILINNEHLDLFYNKIRNKNTSIPDFELIICRNILIILGISNKIAAKGNNDSRLDLIGIVEGRFTLGEIDFKNNDHLSLIRKTLENISVIENKFKIPLENIIPIIVINDLPNKRSEMYELIDDIYKVLNIKIYTLPLHYFLISLFTNNKIKLNNIQEFFINKSNAHFGEPLKKAIKKLDEIDPYFKLENKYKPLK